MGARTDVTVAADLHVHSTCSDGRKSPADIVRLAKDAGLFAVALSDHDTIAGLDEAAEEAARVGIRFIPGIEVSTQTDGLDIHLLVYWPRATEAFAQMLADADAQRKTRALKIVENLAAAGFPVNADMLISQGLKPNRPNIARILVAQGAAPSVGWCFDNLFGEGRPYYIPRIEVPTATAIQTAREAGGVPFLAHPAVSHAEHLIGAFAEAGLVGVEVYHSEQTMQDSQRILQSATRFGLAISGGTDWHGDGVHGCGLGECGLSAAELEAFLELEP